MKLSPTVKASWELLGLSPGAAEKELKRAYHCLALLYHPDRNSRPEAVAEFRKITEAFALLSDPARVAELNRRHLREKLHRQVVEGLTITFGSFFGYRLFDLKPSTQMKAERLLTTQRGESQPPFASQAANEKIWEPIQENDSILDNSAYDAIEVVYAGKLSSEDENLLKGEVESKKLIHLPWVLLNNQGILKFLEGDIRSARKAYRELCDRVPNNIIFTYRLGLLEIIDGFQKPRRTFLGFVKPDQIKIERGLALLRHCLKLGEERTVGKQKCLVIRKTIADVLEKTGRRKESARYWQAILKENPESVEAVFKVRGVAAAFEGLKSLSEGKSKPSGSTQPSLTTQLSRSKEETEQN